jgi:hypothetical protein
MMTARTMTMARMMTAVTATAVAAVFLPDSQQSTKMGSGRSGNSNGNSKGYGDSDNKDDGEDHMEGKCNKNGDGNSGGGGIPAQQKAIN